MHLAIPNGHPRVCDRSQGRRVAGKAGAGDPVAVGFLTQAGVLLNKAAVLGRRRGAVFERLEVSGQGQRRIRVREATGSVVE